MVCKFRDDLQNHGQLDCKMFQFNHICIIDCNLIFSNNENKLDFC